MRTGKSLIAILFAAFCLTASMLPDSALQAQAARAGAYPGAAEVDMFRKNIEPLFMKDRGGSDPGYASCVMCHT